MLKTKTLRIVAFILCVAVLCVSEKAYASDEDLYLEALEEKLVSSTRTAMVERGIFIESKTAQGRLTTQNSTMITNTIDVGTVEFVSYSQLYGTYINEGDKIAEIKVNIDRVAVNELAMRIERAEENLQTFIEENEELIKEYERIKNRSTNGREKELATLAYDKLMLSYATDKQLREEEIEKLKEEYEKYQRVNEKEYITAPSSGIIADYYNYNIHDTIYPGSYIARLYDVSKVMVYVDGASDKLRYNMPVTVVQTRGSKSVTLEGRVTSCRSAAITNDLVSPVALILLEGDPSELSIAHEVTVLYQSKCMENVLMVPKNAVEKDDYGTYVSVLKDGNSLKKYVTCGGENHDKVWIINGLTEGDTVIVK